MSAPDVPTLPRSSHITTPPKRTPAGGGSGKARGVVREIAVVVSRHGVRAHRSGQGSMSEQHRLIRVGDAVVVVGLGHGRIAIVDEDDPALRAVSGALRLVFLGIRAEAHHHLGVTLHGLGTRRVKRGEHVVRRRGHAAVQHEQAEVGYAQSQDDRGERDHQHQLQESEARLMSGISVHVSGSLHGRRL